MLASFTVAKMTSTNEDGDGAATALTDHEMHVTINTMNAMRLPFDVVSIIIDFLFQVCGCGQYIDPSTSQCINSAFENEQSIAEGQKFKHCKGFNHKSCSRCSDTICCSCALYGFCTVCETYLSLISPIDHTFFCIGTNSTEL